MQTTSTCLWFATQAAEAAAFYTSIFPNSRILDTTHYLDNAPMPAGTVLTVRFELDGVEYMALNGGPIFEFSPAISLVAYCDTQAELDRVWEALLADGGAEVQCGWLTDKFGVSWQVSPRNFAEILNAPDRAAAQRAFDAMMEMVKLDIAALQRAFDGK